MRFLKRKKPERLASVMVYYLSRVDQYGKARATPIGTVPRLSEELKASLQSRIEPGPGPQHFVGGETNTVTFVASWNEEIGGVDALSFLSADDARAFPGFQAMPAADLVKLDGLLEHFPRDRGSVP